MFLVHKDGKRYRIPTDRVRRSWNFPLVIKTTDECASQYPLATTKLGFRDGTLLNNIADGKLYIVSESKLRQITSPDALVGLGLTKADALVVSDSEINFMREGLPLDG